MQPSIESYASLNRNSSATPLHLTKAPCIDQLTLTHHWGWVQHDRLINVVITYGLQMLLLHVMFAMISNMGNAKNMFHGITTLNSQ